MAERAKADSTGETHVPGDTRTARSRVLDAGAAATQDFTPIKQVCAHLNGFHPYASDPTRCVEANHYCTHLTEGRLSNSESPIPIYDPANRGRYPPMPTLRQRARQSQTHRHRIHGVAAPLPNAALRRAQTMAYARVRGQERHAYHAHARRHA